MKQKATTTYKVLISYQTIYNTEKLNVPRLFYFRLPCVIISDGLYSDQFYFIFYLWN